MNTTQVTEIQIFLLTLNMMRDSKIEMNRKIAISYNRQKLIDWYKAQKVEFWKDPVEEWDGITNYGKTFAKGSELEWYNYADDEETFEPGTHGHGIHELWVTQKEIDNRDSIILVE